MAQYLFIDTFFIQFVEERMDPNRNAKYPTIIFY